MPPTPRTPRTPPTPRTPRVRLRAVVCIAAIGVLSVASVARDARACGGCFHEPPPPNQSGTVVTDHRMIFSVSSQQTTLYDQIKYSGAPSSFAWVLPIRAAVTVGLSSDIVFASLEQSTQTDIVAPILPSCPSSNCFCGGGGSSSSSGGGFSSGASGTPPPVTVISQQTIGPYATVQLQSTDPTALDSWLTANGYVIPPDVQPIIAAYVHDGFDFLALKLAPGQGIQAMRPVRVTSPGAGVTLPLRMVAAGTGATVGITLWVVGQGRYEPKNFQFFTISASDLTWDWSAQSSDYAAVRARSEGALNNAAWQIESSLDISPYQVENAVLGATSMVSDYVAVPASDGGGGGKGANQLRLEDLAALFPDGGTSVRITRMRADLSHAALANDLVLQASADQSTLSNVYDVTKSVNAPQCPPPVTCNCGGGSGTPSASSSGGVVTSGGDTSSGASGAGGPATDDAGAGGNRLSPGGGGCAAAMTMPGDGAAGFVAAGFIGTALLRARRRRRS
jgi:hypothetical protein